MKPSNLVNDYFDCDGDGLFWANIENGFIYQWDDPPTEVSTASANHSPSKLPPSRREIVLRTIEDVLGCIALFVLFVGALAVLT